MGLGLRSQRCQSIMVAGGGGWVWGAWMSRAAHIIAARNGEMEYRERAR